MPIICLQLRHLLCSAHRTRYAGTSGCRRLSESIVARGRTELIPITAFQIDTVVASTGGLRPVPVAGQRHPGISPGHSCRDEAHASAACPRTQAREISSWRAAFWCARAKAHRASDARAYRKCRSDLQQPCAGTPLSRRHDHMRLNFTGHRAFAMAAGDRLRRAVGSELKQAGVARLDFVTAAAFPGNRRWRPPRAEGARLTCSRVSISMSANPARLNSSRISAIS